jgi:hypothetical protein
MVLSGQLRNYVTIQQGTRTSDGQGGYTTAWLTLTYEWMKATPLNMSRTLDEGGIKYRMAVEFVGRWRNDMPLDPYGLIGNPGGLIKVKLTPEYRIVWNAEYYTIASVVPNEVLSEIKILAYV